MPATVTKVKLALKLLFVGVVGLYAIVIAGAPMWVELVRLLR